MTMEHGDREKACVTTCIVIDYANPSLWIPWNSNMVKELGFAGA